MRGLPAKIVPWTSVEEWEFVRDGLFNPSDDAMQLFALEIARVWLNKARVPTAVEATVNLIQLARQDSSETHLDESVIRLAYSAEITRFVNETVDPRQGGVNVIPITRLAEQVGLPRVLVDLRHESVHDALPSLEMLRYGVEEALRWLWNNYWVPQSAHDEMLVDRVKIALDRTAAALKVAVDKGENQSRTSLAKLANRFMTEVDYLHSSNQVVSLLCEMLFSSEQYLELLDVIVEMYIMASENNGSDSVSGCHLMADAVIKYISTEPIITDRLFETGMKALKRLLDGMSSVDGPFVTALQVLVTHPTQRSAKVIESIFTSGKEVKNKMMAELYVAIWAALSSSSSNQQNIDKLAAIKTIEDVKRMTPDPSQSQQQPMTEWTVAVDWRPCPLGCVPGYNPAHDFMSLWQQQQTQ
jgi:ribosomal biogenesis protein LAS1